MGIDKLTTFDDSRGSLLPIEFSELPFQPKRLFVVKNVPCYEVRGNHAHYMTKQLLICLKGEIDVTLHDGISETTKTLKENEKILIPEMVWDSQRFVASASELLVLCSTNYDINDYIFDFDLFIKLKSI